MASSWHWAISEMTLPAITKNLKHETVTALGQRCFRRKRASANIEVSPQRPCGGSGATRAGPRTGIWVLYSHHTSSLEFQVCSIEIIGIGRHAGLSSLLWPQGKRFRRIFTENRVSAKEPGQGDDCRGCNSWLLGQATSPVMPPCRFI